MGAGIFRNPRTGDRATISGAGRPPARRSRPRCERPTDQPATPRRQSSKGRQEARQCVQGAVGPAATRKSCGIKGGPTRRLPPRRARRLPDGHGRLPCIADGCGATMALSRGRAHAHRAALAPAISSITVRRGPMSKKAAFPGSGGVRGSSPLISIFPGPATAVPALPPKGLPVLDFGSVHRTPFVPTVPAVGERWPVEHPPQAGRARLGSSASPGYVLNPDRRAGCP